MRLLRLSLDGVRLLVQDAPLDVQRREVQGGGGHHRGHPHQARDDAVIPRPQPGHGLLVRARTQARVARHGRHGGGVVVGVRRRVLVDEVD